MTSVMFVAHASDSTEQRGAEASIIAAASRYVGIALSPASLRLPGGARIDVDGASADGSVVVEAYAHQGALRGAQFHKVARDMLKLITLARARPETRLVLAFADAEAARCVTNASWLAEAASLWSVEVFVADVPDDVRAAVSAAQIRQVMVNKPVPD